MDPKKHILNIIKKNLNNFSDYTVFLFWSRATWSYQKISDYDIWILWKSKIPYTTFLKIKRELNDLPFLVDFVDFGRVEDKVFKDLALKDTIKWN